MCRGGDGGSEGGGGGGDVSGDVGRGHPVKRNLIHLALSCKILSTRAKIDTSCQDLDRQNFLEHLDKILARSYQAMSRNFLGVT